MNSESGQNKRLSQHIDGRRTFLKSITAGATALAIAPAIHTVSRAADEVLVGDDEHKYRVHHQWAQLPDSYTWQTTHNVAIDKDNNLYVIHEGLKSKKDHPAIFVFDNQGKFVRAFAAQFQGGGHGLEVRTEGKEQFLYVTGYKQVKAFAKMTLQGEIVWIHHAPMESEAYAAKEDSDPQEVWGRDRFMPTNFAFLDDGEFYLADGYGSYYIHRYDANGKWLGKFGGEGDGAGTFNTPHGIWIDRRNEHLPVIVVTDRAHNSLQRFTLEGAYVDTIEGFGLPANIDTRGDLLLVPELMGRVTLLGKDNQPIVRLGDDYERVSADKDRKIRQDPTKWVDGKFVHPHDACFDSQGNIYVAEWVEPGRVTKLERVS